MPTTGTDGDVSSEVKPTDVKKKTINIESKKVSKFICSNQKIDLLSSYCHDTKKKISMKRARLINIHFSYPTLTVVARELMQIV